MKVRLRIESLVLDGLQAGAHQESAVREAIVNELRQQFGSREKFAATRATRLSATAPAFAGKTPEQLGGEIGRAIHGSLPRNAE
jgi:hypothetical protein